MLLYFGMHHWSLCCSPVGSRERQRGRQKIYTSKCNMQMLYIHSCIQKKYYYSWLEWIIAKEDEIIHKDSCPLVSFLSLPSFGVAVIWGCILNTLSS